eukprot:scaffold12826_cov75-Skeletonema_dohrnii-CCMP3373.AAC.3
MVSKKKAKGKARKAKKEEEKDVHDDSAAAAAQQREQDGALEAQLQMQRLIIDSLPSPCQHGFVPFPEGHICDRFLTLYASALHSSSEDNFFERIFDAMEAVEDKYPEVLRDSSKMKQILSYYISSGTQQILNGDDDDDARGISAMMSAMIVMFEEFIAFRVHKAQAGVHHQKYLEMITSDDHTLVSFYRKRITCTCLDKKHKEVKSIKKMGFCNNDKCPHPGRKVERSKMLYCTRCRYAYYCSRDCQEADWRGHKKFCNERAEQTAQLEQEMRKQES